MFCSIVLRSNMRSSEVTGVCTDSSCRAVSMVLLLWGPGAPEPAGSGYLGELCPSGMGKDPLWPIRT
jgi:hypothetical protein